MPDKPKAVLFKCGADTFSLTLGFRAICALEEEFDRPFGEIAQMMQGRNVRLSYLVSFFKALLIKEHPETTAERASDIIEAIGIEEAARLLGETFEASGMADQKATASEPKGRKAA